MQVIIINDHSYISGGASRVAITSAAGLANRLKKVYFFSAVPPIDMGLERVIVVCMNQHEILLDPIRLRAAVQGYWNCKASRKFGELLDTLDPNDTVIHLHTWTKALSSSVIKAALRRGFHLVCTLHDYFTACPNGGFFDYQSESICQRVPLSFDCLLRHCDSRSYAQKIWRSGRQFVNKYYGGIPDHIRHFIGVSEMSLDILRPYLPCGAKTYIVNNPIDIGKRPKADPSGNNAYMFVGRISVDKGPHLLAKACRDLGIRSEYVGDGPITDLVRRVDPSAKMTGWLPSGVIRETLENGRALVLPSIWYETQGLVVLEAAAIGLPAIVPDTSAAREFVEDGVTGLWFKGGNLESLKEKILHLQDNGTVRRLSENAYERYWTSPYTMDSHLDKLMEVYDRVLRA